MTAGKVVSSLKVCAGVKGSVTEVAEAVPCD